MRNLSTRLNNRYTWLALIIALFWLTRLPNLTEQPIIVDEARHITRAHLTLTEGDWFIGLRESLKQFYVWVLALLLIPLSDAIWAGRFVSVLSGFVSLLVVYHLAEMFYPQRRLGWLAAGFYLISPMALFYDRVAMTDALLTALMGLSILLSGHLWRTKSIGWAIGLGLVWTAATLTKAYAAFFYITPLLMWLLWRDPSNHDLRWAETGLFIRRLSVAYGVTLLAWLPLILLGTTIHQTDHAYKFNAADGIDWPSIWHVASSSSTWLTGYLTAPLSLLLLCSAILSLIQRQRSSLILLTLTASPIITFSLTLSIEPTRYLLPLLVPLSVLAAYGVAEISRILHPSALWGKANAEPLLRGLLLLTLSLPALHFDYLLLTDPPRAPLPAVDKWNYVEGRFSGYGLRESAAQIRHIAQNAERVTLLRGTNNLDSIFSLDIDTVRVYLLDVENVVIRPISQIEADTIDQLNGYAQQSPTFTVGTFDRYREQQYAFNSLLAHPQAQQVANFVKPGGQHEVRLFQWLPPP